MSQSFLLHALCRALSVCTFARWAHSDTHRSCKQGTPVNLAPLVTPCHPCVIADEGADVLAALATLQHLSASHVVDHADRLSRCSALTALTAVELKHVRL